MTDEIIEIKGIQYKLSSDRPLTQEQRSQAIAETMKQLGCSTCGDTNSGRILSMSPGVCPAIGSPASYKVVNGAPDTKKTVAMVSAPRNGIGPYTVEFYKDTTLLQTTPGVTNTTSAPYNYIVAAGDVKLPAGTPTSFNIRVIDTGCNNNVTTDSCMLTVVNLLIATITGCPSTTQLPNTSIPLSSSVSGGAATYHYAWKKDGVAVGTDSQNYAFLTGTANTTIDCTVTDASGQSNAAPSCVVSVSCPVVAPGLTIT